MRRQIALLDYALGTLRRDRRKTVALTVGLALVVTLFTSTLLLTGALRREYGLSADRMPDLTVQRLVGGRPALIPVGEVVRIRDVPAVRSVTPRVWGYHYLTTIDANLTIIGVADPPAALAASLDEGRAPTADDEVALGWALREHLGLRVGDQMLLRVNGEDHFSRVVGTFRDDSAVRSADLVLTTPANARRLLGVEDGYATDLAVDLTTESESAVAAARIAERIEGARVLERGLLRRTYDLTFDARSGLLATWLLPALAAFLLLAFERLSGLGARERREIGVLKAMGWSTTDVLASRMWSSAVISTVGCAVGMILSYLYVFALGAPGLLDALLGWSAIYPPLSLSPAVDAVDVLSLFAAVVVPFVGISLVPAWRAAMIDPHEAIRGLA